MRRSLIFVVVTAAFTVLLSPVAAHAENTVSVSGTPDCGYDATTDTFRPTVTVVRNGYGTAGTDTRVGVSMRLFDDANGVQIGSGLNTGAVNTTGNAAVDLPDIGDSATVTLNGDPLVVFGDGTPAGGTLPPAPHSFTLHVRMLDFTVLDFTWDEPFTCSSSTGGGGHPVCVNHLHVYVNGSTSKIAGAMEGPKLTADDGDACVEVIRLNSGEKNISKVVLNVKKQQGHVICGRDRASTTWWYDEMHGPTDSGSVHTVAQDQDAIARCAVLFPGATKGTPFAAASAWSEGETAVRDRAGATPVTYFLLELYERGTNIPSPAFLGGDMVGMISVGYNTDGIVKSRVAELCANGDVLAMWRGSGSNTLAWTTARENAIVEALQGCVF